MKRPYVSGTAEDIVFFTGIEVERTPAYQQKTLFVVGLHTDSEPIQQFKLIEDIALRARLNKCTHIYLGANQSFVPDQDTPFNSDWYVMITRLIDAFDGLVTLDFDVQYVHWVLDSGLCERPNFIPQISIKLPYALQLGYNATVKIDDTDFAASNAGVWCHRLHDLMCTCNFTPWTAYTKDEIDS
jgi:hypothetical protein